jgi:hypothetical protein
LAFAGVRVWEKRVILAALEDFASPKQLGSLSRQPPRTESQTSD